MHAGWGSTAPASWAKQGALLSAWRPLRETPEAQTSYLVLLAAIRGIFMEGGALPLRDPIFLSSPQAQAPRDSLYDPMMGRGGLLSGLEGRRSSVVGADPDRRIHQARTLHSPAFLALLSYTPSPSSPPLPQNQPKELELRTGFWKKGIRCALPLTCWVSFCNSVPQASSYSPVKERRKVAPFSWDSP